MPLQAQPDGASPDEPAELIARIEAPRQPGSSDDAGKSLAELMETHGIPALSLAVVEDYRLTWAKAYGVADETTGARADVETLFQAASISKPLSAMAVLRAVQDGLFELDDDINSVLRSWPLDDDAELLEEMPVTPRMLLSMTAGTTVSGFPGYKPGAELPSLPEILGREGQTTRANTEPVVVSWQPGTRYEYSGGGSTILQLALSDVRERPFEEILQETILEPLDMTRSCYCQPLPAALEVNTARAGGSDAGQVGDEGGPSAKWHVYPELYAAGLWTTPTDLARFLIEVQLSLEGRSNRILSTEFTRKMVTPGGVGHYALARVAARFGGFHVSHMREEGLELLAAVEETIRIGEDGGLPTQLTHHKVVGAPMWGASERSSGDGRRGRHCRLRHRRSRRPRRIRRSAPLREGRAACARGRCLRSARG